MVTNGGKRYFHIDKNAIKEQMYALLDDAESADKDDVDNLMHVIDHLNLKFSEVLSNDKEQSIDQHMVKFKGRSGMKQYKKSKPIKWGFKFWFHCSSKSSYLHQMAIYLGRKQTPEFNLGLGKEVVLQLMKDLEQLFCTVYLTTFLIIQS